MNCPDCSQKLEIIEFKPAKKKLKLKIVYCSYCGGYWLDSLTVNNLSYKDIEQLEKLLKISSLSPQETKLCPQCQIPLQRMEEESIPHEIFIFSCNRCYGRWFPGHQLLKFKKAQEAKLQYFKEWKIPLKSIFAILLPILIIIPLAIHFRPRKQAEIYLVKPEGEIIEEEFSKPLVTYLEAGEIEISFSTQTPCLSFLEYGLAKDKVNRLLINDKPSLSHKIIISKLQPKTIYWYRLISKIEGKEFVSSFYSFETK